MIRRCYDFSNVSMWSTTFRRFPDGQVPVIGPITVTVHDWTRPAAGESRIFQQDFLEQFTFARPAVPIAVYAPGGIALAWYAGHAGVRWLTVAAAYGGGLLIWTLVEYVMHRFSFHHAPATRVEVAIAYLVHGVHHAYPDDSRRWMMPLVVTIPIVAALTLLAYAVGGAPALPVLGGFVHGYLAYDTLHHAIHRGANRSRAVRWLRKHHMQHHYATPDKRFGVSSPLWDLIFRTSR
jgi:sterol desaturase/sphingolipid hydroxylase (fatty acid hydroxylase superfamily)